MKKTNYLKEGNWYKGNTHLHTTRSDGKKTPEQALEQYNKLGYDFFVMSDHRIYYDSTKLDKKNFLVLSGIEFNTNHKTDTFRTHHITALKKYSENNEYENDQKIVFENWKDDKGYKIASTIIKEAKENDNFTILAHPEWSCTFPEELLEIKGYDAIEVWNHECQDVSATGNGEFYWDYLLKKGRKVLAIASDDIHSYRDNAIGGYIVVKAEKFTKESIAKAIIQGSYYASTGPKINEFYIEDGFVYAKGSKCKYINFITNRRGKGFSKEANEAIQEASYKLLGHETYIRCEFIDFNGRKAWSNPLYLD